MLRTPEGELIFKFVKIPLWPLIVLDGIIFRGDLAEINPGVIESGVDV
ncbi:hypothetical protein WJR50_26045 [Catalinimonas sp. 4WD22]